MHSRKLRVRLELHILLTFPCIGAALQIRYRCAYPALKFRDSQNGERQRVNTVLNCQFTKNEKSFALTMHFHGHIVLLSHKSAS
jgi:hypothetical protein